MWVMWFGSGLCSCFDGFASGIWFSRLIRCNVFSFNHLCASVISKPRWFCVNTSGLDYLHKYTQALCYAKKSFDWRNNYYTSCCIVDFKKETFDVSSNVTVPALSYNIPSNKEHVPSPCRVLQCYFQSCLQLGSIYNYLGDGNEASRYLQDGKALSMILNLPIFSVSIPSELVKLHRKHLKWNEAETELNMEISRSMKLPRSIISVETTEDLEDVAGFYKDAEKLLKLSLWGNDVSCPKDESVKTTRNCVVIDKSSSNYNGFLKGCWHCQRDEVAASKSLTMHLDLKWECFRRRLLIRALKGLAKYHEARGHTADERKALFYNVSVMVSRVASKEDNSSKEQNSSNLVTSMIDDSWTGDAYSIEHNRSIKIASIVLGLKIAFLLSSISFPEGVFSSHRNISLFWVATSEIYSSSYTVSIEVFHKS